MCMQCSAVRSYQQWRWSGDEIVHSPIVPAARRPAGSRKIGYPIDIRAFILTENNAVIQQHLQSVINTLPADDRLYFYKKSAGCFDFRADAIVHSMLSLKYRPGKRCFDAWLFPDETLHLGGGDCEDLAFLLAALLAASGISTDCIRVVLGTITDHSQADNPRSWDHAWVVYQQENSAWKILEPMAKIGQINAHFDDIDVENKPPKKLVKTRQKSDVHDVSYTPHFVFNSHHLWRVRNPDRRTSQSFIDYLDSRDSRFWSGFNPSFAAGVHADIYDQALAGMSSSSRLIVKAVSLGVDANVLQYDPRDHFDFGYIDEGWRGVNERLATGQLKDFGLATHAIADFYAHTLYGYFAKPQANGHLPIFDPQKPIPADQLDYSFLKKEKRPGSACSDQTFLSNWNGKLISGQWWRWYSTYPNELRADLPKHRCLPDHDRLAVDGPTMHGENALFADAAAYKKQFELRRQASIDHISAVYQKWQMKNA
jgi:hypothetical protein